MRRILLSAATMLLTSVLCSAETISASDERVSWIGRTEICEGAVSFDWSATTLRLRFNGSSLTMKCSDTHRDYFNLWVDCPQGAEMTSVVKIDCDSTIVLFKSKKKGVHEVILQKRTEGEQGTATIVSFTTDGAFLAAPAKKPRTIEFIGDSYTCGYGTEAPSRDDPFKAETENPALTYADIIGRLFDAEAVHISHSGRGIIRNYGDYNPESNMVKLYKQTYDMHSEALWTPTYTPDLVVIYLGTNDFSTGKQPNLWAWCDNYAQLLRQVRAFHGDAVQIICMASKADEQMAEYVRQAVVRSGVAGVHFCSILSDAHNDEGDLGASWHPNYKGHRKVASILAPYVSTVTGWDLPFKVYE